MLADPWRPRLAAALAVLTAVLLAVAAVSGYARYELLDTQEFSARVTSSLDDSDVRNELSRRVVDGVASGVTPDVLAIRPLVTSALAAVADTGPFRRIFARALADQHRALFHGNARAVLDLEYAGTLLRESLRGVSPRVASAIPPGTEPQLAELDEGDARLVIARKLTNLADWLWPLIALALLAAAGCAFLAGGVREALGHLGAAVVAAGLTVAGLVTVAGASVVGYVAGTDDQQARGAVRAIWEALFADLRTAGLIAAVGGLVMAGVATRRPTVTIAWLRGAIRSPSRPAQVARGVVLVLLGAAAIIEPGLAARAVLVVVGLALILLGIGEIRGRLGREPLRAERPADDLQADALAHEAGAEPADAEVSGAEWLAGGLGAERPVGELGDERPIAAAADQRVAATAGEPSADELGAESLASEAGAEAPGGRRGRGRPLILAGIVVGVVTVTVLAAALVLPAPRVPPPVAALTGPAGSCNGSPRLCDLRLDQVAFASTHNSYAASDEPGWLFPNQRYGIERQLRDGIRGLLIDIHYGVRDPGSGLVRTDLAAEGSDRNKVRQQLSPQALRVADRLAGRAGVGATPSGAPKPYMCHTLCELGSEPLDEQFDIVKRFLDAHPGEVIVMFVEPYVPVAEIQRSLERTDLLAQAAELQRDEPLPTLGTLVRANTRLVILAEKDGGARAWYLPGFSFAQDTPLRATNASELRCDRFRGTADSPLFLVNHWIDAFPPSPSRNERIGGRVLSRRLDRCQRERGLPPNLIAVDFYERTGVVGIAHRRNERAATGP